ncbi:MAG: divergent polysaccharide deacetylase family protein, partial [Asticcacaulis sp.]
MFTRKKLSALSSSSLVRPVGSFQARMKALGQGTWAVVKKPYVAPVLALFGLLGAGGLFLGLASNPEAGSPQIRVNLARFTPTETRAQETGEVYLSPMSGDAAFGLDSVGLFDNASASGFGIADAGPIDGTAVQRRTPQDIIDT